MPWGHPASLGSVTLISLRSLLAQAFQLQKLIPHDGVGGGIVAFWDRMPWPQRRGTPCSLLLKAVGTGVPCCLDAFIHVTGKAPALKVEGVLLLLFLSLFPSAASPFL